VRLTSGESEKTTFENGIRAHIIVVKNQERRTDVSTDIDDHLSENSADLDYAVI
jgi:hypothetical protein